jgi:hypothetical protein
MMPHNPALFNFPAEASIIGRMVVGFGELEFMVCLLAGKVRNQDDLFLKALYSLRITSARIETANVLMTPFFVFYGLQDEQTAAVSAVEHCQSMRNQYAHCHWADGGSQGLFFADAKKSARRTDWFFDYKHVDVPLLEQQERYFGYARQCLLHLDWQVELRIGRSQYQGAPAPQELRQPPLHNLASEHIPQWLPPDQKARHIERAQVAERPASQPERSPSVPRLTEAEWEAKRAKEARERGLPS